jgi:outer membrane protein TolC
LILQNQALQGHKILRPLGLIINIALLSTALGCATTDFNQTRSKHAEEFPKELAQKSQDLVKPGEPLDLDACIKIALDNNLDIKIAEIKGNLATIDRKIAFSYFLPYVEVQVTRLNNDEQRL